MSATIQYTCDMILLLITAKSRKYFVFFLLLLCFLNSSNQIIYLYLNENCVFYLIGQNYHAE
jgi:hypothetical protein